MNRIYVCLLKFYISSFLNAFSIPIAFTGSNNDVLCILTEDRVHKCSVVLLLPNVAQREERMG